MDRPVVDELLGPAPGGRVFALDMHAGLADCAPTGRIRLDGLARWLQDVAYGDVEDAALQDAAVWVVRRTRIRVQRFPRFAERFEVRTFCSGIGRMWAERRTTVARSGALDGVVEAVSLWVHLDPLLRRPTPLTEHELAVYGALGHDRRISARLRHPAPDSAAREAPWTFRATECDLADHVNNAAYWAPFEEELLAGPDPETIDVEIEFRAPAQPGEKRILSAEGWRWIVNAEGEVHASMRLLSGVAGPAAG